MSQSNKLEFTKQNPPDNNQVILALTKEIWGCQDPFSAIHELQPMFAHFLSSVSFKDYLPHAKSELISLQIDLLGFLNSIVKLKNENPESGNDEKLLELTKTLIGSQIPANAIFYVESLFCEFVNSSDFEGQSVERRAEIIGLQFELVRFFTGLHFILCPAIPPMKYIDTLK